MPVLPREASFAEFRDYVVGLRGDVPRAELDDLWERHQKLRGIGFATGAGYRSTLPPDEQHLTREQLGQKTVADAKAAGRHIERLPDKVYF